MALFTIDKLWFRNILVRGRMPEEQAVEFAEASEETLESHGGVVRGGTHRPARGR